MSSKFKAVIFDFDNTVVVSNEDHVRSYIQAAKKFNLKMDGDEVRRLFGRSAYEIIDNLYPDLSKADKKRMRDMKEVLYRRIISKKAVKTIPGIRKLLNHLKKEGYKIGIVSSASVKNIRIGLKMNGLGGYFRTRIGAEDVKRHKPDPQALLKMARRLKVKPQECVFIGDAVYDMMAARRAKMTGIGVATGFYTMKDLKSKGGKFAFKDHRGILKLFLSGRI